MATHDDTRARAEDEKRWNPIASSSGLLDEHVCRKKREAAVGCLPTPTGDRTRRCLSALWKYRSSDASPNQGSPLPSAGATHDASQQCFLSVRQTRHLNSGLKLDVIPFDAWLSIA